MAPTRTAIVLDSKFVCKYGAELPTAPCFTINSFLSFHFLFLSFEWIETTSFSGKSCAFGSARLFFLFLCTKIGKDSFGIICSEDATINMDAVKRTNSILLFLQRSFYGEIRIGVIQNESVPCEPQHQMQCETMPKPLPIRRLLRFGFHYGGNS